MRFEGRDSNLYRYVGNEPVSKVDPLGLCWSAGRAVAHYENPFNSDVTSSEIGCESEITSATESVRNSWKLKISRQIEEETRGHLTDFSKSYRESRGEWGVKWIGGISIAGSAECQVTFTNIHSAKYSCNLNFRMHDRFEDPFDLDNSHGRDWWDDIEVGKPFYVSQAWSDQLTGSVCPL